MIRNVLLLMILVGFIGLGIIDLQAARYTTGMASLCLAAANYLLLIA